MIRQLLIAVLFLVAACGFVPAAAPPEPASLSQLKSTHRGESLELVIFRGEKLVRVELKVEVDGRSISAIWEETFAKLFAHHDTNRDGFLDAKEAAHLPSSFALRQLLWGQSVPYSGRPVELKALDRDSDGKVSRSELVEYYRRGGLGHILVGVGRPQATQALTAALLKGLDSDGNGIVSEAEWQSAADTLHKFDRNDDELIGPGELVPKTAYPGTLGAVLLSPPSTEDTPLSEHRGLPLVILPADTSDTGWATVVVTGRDQNRDGKLSAKEAGLPIDVFAELDRDGDRKLSPAELVAWRNGKPITHYTIRFGKRATDQSPLDRSGVAFATGRLRFDVRFDSGKMPELVSAARKRFLDIFTDADADADGFVEENEIIKRNHADLRQLRLIADSDSDGKLSRKELGAWLDLQDQVATGQVLLTVLDHGSGLFELLDVDHDGSLSIPELRQAWQHVKEAGCLTATGTFDPATLPRQLLLTVSRGHPLNPLGSARREGPAWFRAMDRNGDGFVSRREFTGTADLFGKLDLDRDGFISPEEGQKAAKSKK